MARRLADKLFCSRRRMCKLTGVYSALVGVYGFGQHATASAAAARTATRRFAQSQWCVYRCRAACSAPESCIWRLPPGILGPAHRGVHYKGIQTHAQPLTRPPRSKRWKWQYRKHSSPATNCLSAQFAGPHTTRRRSGPRLISEAARCRSAGLAE